MTSLPDLNPDTPHSPSRTREIAALLAECARTLNYCSMAGNGGLEYPADVYDLLGHLYVATSRLPQLLAQIDAFLAAQYNAGRLAATDGAPVPGLISGAGMHLHYAEDDARGLTARLQQAQNAISGLYVKEDPDDQPGT